MPASYWYNQAEIKSYDDAKALFKRARKPAEGKPVKSWTRLFKNGDCFELRCDYTTLAVIKPDNTITFPLSISNAKGTANTLASSLYRVLPFMWMRLGKGRYAIEHTKVLDDYVKAKGLSYYWGSYMRDKSPELHSGLKFNLLTGECLNARSKPNGDVNKIARSAWLTALRGFKRGIQIRAKIGVIDGLCQQVVAERGASRDRWQQPDWSHDQWTEMLFTAIKNNEFSTELLKGFVMSSKVSYWRHETPTTKSTLEAVDNICDELSIELRRRFGVFDA